MKSDIKKELNKFYKLFSFIILKLTYFDLNVKLKLFQSYCLQIHGIELWINLYKLKEALK